MHKIKIATITVAAAALAAGSAIPAFASTPRYPAPPKPSEPAWCKTYQPNGKNKNWGWDYNRDRCCPETVKVIKVRGRWEVVDVLGGRDCVTAAPKPRPEPSWLPPKSPKPSWTPTSTPTPPKNPKPKPSWTPKPTPTVTVTVTATPA